LTGNDILRCSHCRQGNMIVLVRLYANSS
jgi:hypothetical protein